MRKLEQKGEDEKLSESEKKAPERERSPKEPNVIQNSGCSEVSLQYNNRHDLMQRMYRTRLNISMHCKCISPNLFLSAPTFFLPCNCPMCAAARTQKHWQRPPGLNLPMYPRLHVRHIFTRSGDWFAFLIIWFALNRATHSLFFSLPSLPSILQPCYYCQSRRPCRKLQQLQKWMAEWFEGWIEL